MNTRSTTTLIPGYGLSARTYELLDKMLVESDKLNRRARVLSWILGFVTVVSFVIAIIQLCHN